MRYLPLAFIVLLIFCSCGNEENDTCKLKKGEAFLINEGQELCLGEYMGIVRSISDSYCPCNADCIWEGEAMVEITVDGIDQQMIFTIHETREIANVYNLYIDRVITDESCDPEIAEIYLIKR